MEARLNYFGNPSRRSSRSTSTRRARSCRTRRLPAATQELVKIRASQINGCGFCTDMHTKDAAARRGNPAAAQPGRGLAGGHGLHRGRARRPGTGRAGHPHRRRGRWRHRRGLGERGQALRRGPARRAGVPHRRHQHLQPHERHHPAARRRLPARPVRLTARGGPARPARGGLRRRPPRRPRRPGGGRPPPRQPCCLRERSACFSLIRAASLRTSAWVARSRCSHSGSPASAPRSARWSAAR